jgi:hypothetical protein
MSDHSITPPPELVRQWLLEYYGSDLGEIGPDEMYLARYGAQWGADQELEACLTEVSFLDSKSLADKIRAARRPKPSSLKEQALDQLKSVEDRYGLINTDYIRRALEQLDD